MSSSTDARVLRGSAARDATPLTAPDLRTGAWTRYGDPDVLGDPITEHTLEALTGNARTAARSQGYAVGWAEGRRLAAERAAEVEAQAQADREWADRRRAAEHRTAIAVLTAAAEQLHEQVAGIAERIEAQATELAVELTRELLGQELRVATAADVVRRVLQVLPTEPGVTVRLAPGMVEAPVVADLVARGVRVVGDPSLIDGDAVVDTDLRVFDLRISAAMERVAKVLT